MKTLKVALFTACLTGIPGATAQQMTSPGIPTRSSDRVALSDEEREILSHRELLENLELLQNLEKVKLLEFLAEPKVSKSKEKRGKKVPVKPDGTKKDK